MYNYLELDEHLFEEDSEDIYKGVKVYLLNEDGEIVKNTINGMEQIVETDENGEYQFKGIEAGRYFIVFMYDDENFEITEYQRIGISSTRDSDAILTAIDFAGNTKEGAVTDLIEILAIIYEF